MKTVDFSALYQMDYKISRVVPTYQYHYENDDYVMEDRPGNGFLLLTNCHMRATGAGFPPVHADSGAICYVPQGSSYTTFYTQCPQEKNGKQVSTNMLINFTLEDEDGEQLRLSDWFVQAGQIDSTYYIEMFDRVVDASAKGNIPLGKVKALLYNLLSDISMEFRKEGIQLQSYAAIYPAIDYIEKHYLQNPSVSVLAKKCAMSESTLRRLFKQYAGMSPLSYIMHLKINRARLLLETTDFSILQVAEACGFDDAAYFSRIYKKKAGVAPSGTQKRH